MMKMNTLKFFSCLAVAANIPSVFASPRVINGEDSKPGHFPYFVHFTTFTDIVEPKMASCGGTLIAPDLVLSAAHCNYGFHEPDRPWNVGMPVAIGAYGPFVHPNRPPEGSQVRYCAAWIPHPLWDDEKFVYDIALCKLNYPVTIDQSFVTLELNEDPHAPAVGTEVIGVGLGAIHPFDPIFPETLQNVTFPTRSHEVCKEIHSKGPYQKHVIDPELTLCADFDEMNGKTTCRGDSGGPLVKRVGLGDGSFVDIQYGLTSWGWWPQCRDAVFARISGVFDWIKATGCGRLNARGPFCGKPEEISMEFIYEFDCSDSLTSLWCEAFYQPTKSPKKTKAPKRTKAPKQTKAPKRT
ncbi:unnamed protein product [Pseudo-nitzschia multistriata]|uniref:Peptidase S1 domain-containing protein n=1 Tax=Pseudo-nitzschia multistriata TaxID=183589 RepID=A0A448ZQC2_9STRA|nr:unnamed protein product [Pseudo-nitzschia multistriata]